MLSGEKKILGKKKLKKSIIHGIVIKQCLFNGILIAIAIDAVCLWPLKIRATLKVCTTLGTDCNLIKKQKHA